MTMRDEAPARSPRPDLLPDPMAGWDASAIAFANGCDPRDDLDHEEAADLEHRYIAPLADALARAGCIPDAYTPRDLRLVLFWLAREDDRTAWSRGEAGPYLRIYYAVIDRLRRLLVRARAAERPTAAGADHPCPWCGSVSVASIMYGMPSFTRELEVELDRGEPMLGGCVATGFDPRFGCNGCAHTFRDGWRPGDPRWGAFPFDRVQGRSWRDLRA